ncbi:MAG: hypothetical protein AAGA96_20570 [Verrucomicrobiota bacterium]
MSSTEDSGQDRCQERSSRGGMGRLFWVVVVVVVAGLLAFWSFIWVSKEGIESASETISEVAKVFRPEQVIQTFDEWREMDATATEGNILEIATATASEKFTRKTNVQMFGKVLPMGTTVSEIDVPATYRYHIDLHGEWFLTSDGSRLLVLAPPVVPSLPVAFDTGKMKKKTKSGWARWDAEENLEELEKTITSKLALRASAPESIEKIRDEARLAVAKFLRTWLLSQDAWQDSGFEEIVVLFDGEDLESGNLSSAPSTLRLQESPVEIKP